jgi:hypothetical protein
MSQFRILSWREVLKELCDTPQKKQEVAEKVGFVSIRTIDRWISGSTDPQKHEYIRNLAALSDELGELLEKQWPEAFSQQPTRLSIERITLPEEFRRRILHAYAHTSRNVQRWTIYQLVSTQMIAHLDPDQTGLMIVYARLEMDTLHFLERSGSSIWITRQVHSETCSEPWLVQAVKAARPFFVQSLPDAALSPPSCFVNADLIQSIGVFPLYRAGCLGGGILLASTKADFFTPVRQTLIEEYAYLLALAFRDQDFQ